MELLMDIIDVKNEKIMKNTIYKYPIPIQDYIKIDLPKNAEVLCVKTQNGEPYIWVLVDTDEEKETRDFRLFGTGNYFDLSEYKYIGTFLIYDDLLVWHLFENLTK